MRVLVLCHGNINRSPFVAALIAHHRPQWEVASAGLKTTQGRRPSRKAREAAAARGITLEGYSEPISIKMVEWADKVLYMDGGNQRRLGELLSAGRDRWLLERCECLASYGSLRRVPDPNYTSDPEKLREQFGIAETCTMKFLEAHPS